MNILVTGGAGFIGSNFIRYMINKYPDYNYVNLDKLTYAGNLDNLKDIENKKNYEFVKGDIADYSLVNQLIKDKKIDTIINFAAESHVDRSVMEAGDFIKTDVLGTNVLLEASKENNISKYVQISTDEVYGDIPEGSFSKESDSIHPSSPYSASKAGGDMQVLAYCRTHKLPAVITRCTNNYGPYQYPEKLIPLFITNLIEDIKVPVYGDGSQIRDWIHVDDHCSGIDIVLHKGKVGEIYNIGANNIPEITNMEITKTILKSMNLDENMIDYVKDRPGHDLRYAVDCTKIKKLGWKSTINFDDGITQTIKWYQENDWWWKKIKSGEYLDYYKKQYITRD